jgi:hypothetical protein
LVDAGKASTQVQRHQHERLVHRYDGVAEASDAAALAESLVQRLAEDKAEVLYEVVRVALDVT